MQLELFAAILCSSVFIKKGLKEINILIIYPLISFIMLGLCYFYPEPDYLPHRWICHRFRGRRRCIAAGSFHNR